MGVIIVREMVGTSPKSWSDAARQAVATAVAHRPQHQDRRGREVERDRRGRRDRGVPGRHQDRLRVRGLNRAEAIDPPDRLRWPGARSNACRSFARTVHRQSTVP